MMTFVRVRSHLIKCATSIKIVVKLEYSCSMSKCSIKCSCKALNFICTELYKCEEGEWKCTNLLQKEVEIC